MLIDSCRISQNHRLLLLFASLLVQSCMPSVCKHRDYNLSNPVLLGPSQKGEKVILKGVNAQEEAITFLNVIDSKNKKLTDETGVQEKLENCQDCIVRIKRIPVGCFGGMLLVVPFTGAWCQMEGIVVEKKSKPEAPCDR